MVLLQVEKEDKSCLKLTNMFAVILVAECSFFAVEMKKACGVETTVRGIVLTSTLRNLQKGCFSNGGLCYERLF